MDPNRFFRAFFGFPRQYREDDRFDDRDRGHPNDDGGLHDADDDNRNPSHHHPSHPPHGSLPRIEIFTNPLDMERFFSHQMEDLMRGFFGAGQFFDEQRGNQLPPPPEGAPGTEHQDESGSAGSRDFMLKEGGEGRMGYVDRSQRGGEKWEDGEVSVSDLEDHFKSSPKNDGQPPHQQQRPEDRFGLVPIFPPGPGGGRHGLFGGIFSADPFFHGQRDDEGDVGPGGGGRGNHQWHSFSYGSSTSRSVVRMPDGSVEERQTVTDSQGNQTTTTTRRIGDKSHTVTTVTRPDGSEERNESSRNLGDENELKDFSDRWQRQPLQQDPQQPIEPFKPRIGAYFGFDTSRFFGGGSEERVQSPRDEMLRKTDETNQSLFKKFFGSD